MGDCSKCFNINNNENIYFYITILFVLVIFICINVGLLLEFWSSVYINCREYILNLRWRSCDHIEPHINPNSPKSSNLNTICTHPRGLGLRVKCGHWMNRIRREHILKLRPTRQLGKTAHEKRLRMHARKKCHHVHLILEERISQAAFVFAVASGLPGSGLTPGGMEISLECLACP